MPKIIISEPGGTPQAYCFDAEHKSISIGRASDNAIVIESPSVSSRHCTLERIQGGYILRDTNSTNGISLDGSPMQLIDLKNGMVVLVGDVSLELQLSKQDLAGPKPAKKNKSIAIISAMVVALFVASYFSYRPSVGKIGGLEDSVNTRAWDKNDSLADSNPPLGQDSKLVHVSSSNAVQLDPDLFNHFLTTYCTDCHGPEKQKGDTRLDSLSLNIANSDTALHWQEVLDVLNLGEMPPEDEKQANNEELQTIIKHLTIALDTSKKRLSEDGGNIALRRINRREYRHTIDQLLGMRIEEKILPADSITEGYDTVGQDQQFSSHHFEDYFETAKSVAKVALKWVDIEKSAQNSRTYQAEGQHKHMYKIIK